MGDRASAGDRLKRMSSSAQLLTGLVEALLQAGVQLGLDRATLLEHAGLEEAALVDRDARVPIRCQIAIGEAIIAARPRVNLGLVVLRRVQPRVLGALGYALTSSRSLDQALATFTRYQSFLTDAMRWRRSDPCTVEVEVHDELARIGHPIETSVGMWVMLGRRLAGTRWIPRTLSFRHAPLGDVREHAELFGVAPHFEAERDVLVLETETLELPVVDATLSLRSPLLELLEARLPTPPEAEIVTRLRAELRRELARGTSKTAVARTLGMSSRTLARRLHEAGTSYTKVLDETRRRLALDLLADPRLAVYELAFLLGYSEPSTFHRAFRRWTGESPDAWRRARA